MTAVGSTAEALEAVRAAAPGRSYDLMLSDIGMAGEDGYALIRQLRTLERKDRGARRGMPAVALTAYARAEDKRRALAAGYQSHVSKPIEPQKLVEVVARLAARKFRGKESAGESSRKGRNGQARKR